MRGAGCTWNDIADRDLDAKVRAHALAADPGRAGERPQRLRVSRIALAFVGLARAAAVQRASRSSPASRRSPSSSVYPFMKRITYWPQVVLGLAFYMGRA